MCGIAGIFDPNQKTENLKYLIKDMLSKTNHRGPDNMGSWVNCTMAMGHNRLKIIDLSDMANQPFEYGEDLVITFNGEIYNYVELREDLKKDGFIFRTESDTEVLAASYMKWGADCVKKFVGMWAFAIWNKAKQELFCSRDRFGIKPFYYICQDGKFYFASEYKPLKNLKIFNGKINQNQLNRGLQLGWTGYFDETYYEQIKSLPAAHSLFFKDGKYTISKYWNPIEESVKYEKTDIKGAFEKFYQLFEDSIKIHSRSDVPVGSCLSGGLDSSSIVSMMGKLFPDKQVKTFTIYYQGKDGVDERPFVHEVIEKYKNVEPYYFSPTENDIIENYDRFIYYSDIPSLGSSYMSQYFLMKLAAQNNIKVILDGQGSDEYLIGYMHSFGRIIGESFRNLQFKRALGITLNHKSKHELSFTNAATVMLKGLYSTLKSEQDFCHQDFKKLNPFLLNGNNHEPFDLKSMSSCKINDFTYHQLFNTSLPTLLFYEDRNSMAFSIESRVPFLDHRLVEFIFSLPHHYKVSNGANTKHILRNAMKGVLPEKIENRQDKKGFNTPGETQWLRGPLQSLLEFDYSYLQWLDKKAVSKLINDFKKGDNSNSRFVWRLASTHYWLKNMN